jgi:LysM repeat protein
MAVIASLSILLLAGFSLATGSQASSHIKVTVKPGETLWSIAAKISDGDRRELVDEIIEVNNLKSPEVNAGQKLFLPTRH